MEAGHYYSDILICTVTPEIIRHLQLRMPIHQTQNVKSRAIYCKETQHKLNLQSKQEVLCDVMLVCG